MAQATNDDIAFSRSLADQAAAHDFERGFGTAVPSLTQALACQIAREVATLPAEHQGKALVEHVRIACEVMAASATTHLEIEHIRARQAQAMAAE